jgi:hypothetical protein
MDLGIAEPILLQHFLDALGSEPAIFLDSSSGGSFTQLTLSEFKDILTKILENTPYTGVYDEFPDEEEIIQEEHMPNTLSKPKTIEEEPILEKFISTNTHPPLTKTRFIGEPFQPYRDVDDPSYDFVYEYYDELFDKHWTEKSFPRRERYSTHKEKKHAYPTQKR